MYTDPDTHTDTETHALTWIFSQTDTNSHIQTHYTDLTLTYIHTDKDSQLQSREASRWNTPEEVFQTDTNIHMLTHTMAFIHSQAPQRNFVKVL